jgi:hypothetical protein
MKFEGVHHVSSHKSIHTLHTSHVTRHTSHPLQVHMLMSYGYNHVCLMDADSLGLQALQSPRTGRDEIGVHAVAAGE